MPGHNHGKSIKRSRAYEALKRRGYSKSSAAAISNAGRTHAARSRMARKGARSRRRGGGRRRR